MIPNPAAMVLARRACVRNVAGVAAPLHPHGIPPMAQPFCTDCQRRMEGGFLLDNHSSPDAGKWVEGPPEKSFWGGLKLKGRRQLTIYAWRCPGCTQVRLFAPEA